MTVNYDTRLDGPMTSTMTTSSEGVLLAHHYQLGDIIETGPFSTIHRAVHRASSRLFTVKSIDLARYTANSGLTRDDVDKEIEICASLKHPYLCELKDVIAGDNAVHMIFEFLDGMDICFEIVKRASAGFVYSEAVASHYMNQLLQAVAYMHQMGIVHRDIRPHNAVLASKDNSASLKLTGFGVAIRMQPDARSTIDAGRIGVPQFMAPEVVAKQAYGVGADLWSCGVLMYILLSGRPPFYGPNRTVYDAMHGTHWQSISDSAKDLLMKLLTVDRTRRISAAEALNHPWIKERDKFAPRRHLQETVDEIRRYNSRRKLKSNILAAVNSSKWSNQRRPSISAQSFMSGDSMPGGDTCNADGCTRRGPQTTTAEMVGVEQILSSLDQIAALTDIPLDATASTNANQSIICALNDTTLRHLLELYDRIVTLPQPSQPPVPDTARCAQELIDFIDALLSPSADAIELRTLLASAQLQAILQANDVIIHEVYGQDGISSAHMSSQTPPPTTTTPAAAAAPAAIPPYLTNGGGTTSSAAGSSTDDADQLRMPYDDDDLLVQVTRVRLVQFQKNSDEPMGITLKVTEDGRCLVARIMHGGMIHRQATLHVGDEIREINGVCVANQSVDALQRMMRDARGSVTFKIVPSYRSAPPACEIFVRAQFDYDPTQDDLIPCAQAGVPFKTGDILQVISKDDHNWWQGRFVANFPALGSTPASGGTTPSASVAGLIPSPELQEWRTACLAMERARDNSHCMWFNKKKKYYTTKYLQKHSALFDQLDLVTYEEVVRLPTYRRKTLVLLGAHGVGRRHIKNTLIQRHPERFSYPIPRECCMLTNSYMIGADTTRPPRKDELDGKHYYFVSHECMLADIHANDYLEYGTHEECMYGTKLETIRNIHRTGKIAILDVEPQALKVLRTAEYSPFVVFIAAPNLQGLQDPDGSLERLLKESELLRQAYGHFFDYVILNNDIDETIRQLELIVEKLHACPQWVSVSWVY